MYAVIHYQYNPIKTVKTCTIGVINMLGLAKKIMQKFFGKHYEVYGDPEVHPQYEDYFGNVNTVGFRSCYDEGKRCSETLFMDYHREHKLNIKIARIFNTFGPNMSINDGRVISNFVTQALNNKNITIYGDGSQTRSFLYIDNLVDGIIKLMDSKDSLTGPINIGSDNEISIFELASEIIKMTNSNSEIIFKKLPEDDPKRRKPNIDFIKKELNWSPNMNLKKGLEKTIKYFNKII